jgi:GTP-binding protein Era
MNSEYKCGFVTIIGRPNTGKSTLINALIGSKVTITSHHPNTTRNPIRAILTKEKYQIILVDTPGVNKAINSLGVRLSAMVAESASEGDLMVLTLPVDEEIGAGDSFIVREYLNPKSKLIIALTKIDKASKDQILGALAKVAEFIAREKINPIEIVPISAHDIESITLFEKLIADQLPNSPQLYPTEITLDQALESTVAEFVREAAITSLREELPHSVMVTVEEMNKPAGKKLLEIQATIHVERDSQKGIILGNKGSKIKEIGTVARVEIENFLNQKVFLGLHVKVSKEWQKDPKALARFGFLDR